MVSLINFIAEESAVTAETPWGVIFALILVIQGLITAGLEYIKSRVASRREGDGHCNLLPSLAEQMPVIFGKLAEVDHDSGLPRWFTPPNLIKLLTEILEKLPSDLNVVLSGLKGRLDEIFERLEKLEGSCDRCSGAAGKQVAKLIKDYQTMVEEKNDLQETRIREQNDFLREMLESSRRFAKGRRGSSSKFPTVEDEDLEDDYDDEYEDEED